ncbi:hypothetical protein [Ferrovibrio sp.]|uniref:hypothetical protein n=1 Tax=Ferrovibrio sp. TaxID=1917215 RepID=UPI003D14C4E2
MRYMADIPGSSPGGYFSGGCYIVLTQLGDSWILRAAHGDMEAAQAEAFRWRRIYGPERTRIAAVNQGASASVLPDATPVETISNLPVIIDVVPEPANDITGATPPKPAISKPPRRTAVPRKTGRPLGWGETLLRALLLYFVYSLANRLIDLAILMQGA